jgi:hypothetical protein
MNKIVYFFLLLPFISFGQKEIFTNTFFSIDNENQINVSSYQGYQTALDSLLKKDSVFIKRKTFLGIANGVRYYQTNIGEPTYFFNEAKIFIKSKPRKNFNFSFNPSLLMSSDFTTFTYDFNTSYTYKKWYVEVSSERDLVGARALEVNLVSNYYGLSVDYSPIKRLTITGGYQYNHITDGNKRSFFVSRFIWTLPNDKIYFDFRTRYMTGGEWSEYYFSPEKISQRQIGVGMNQSFLKDKSVIKLYVGTGLQTIDNQTMYLLSADFKIVNIILPKLKSELLMGVRNFNKYVYGFGDLKLKYTF